eukprot:142005-Chlamydomonas_euryale.AAC.1
MTERPTRSSRSCTYSSLSLGNLRSEPCAAVLVCGRLGSCDCSARRALDAAGTIAPTPLTRRESARPWSNYPVGTQRLSLA